MKGTRFIEQAVAALRAEGLPFEYIRVENLPNHEARRICETADVLIDQLLCGWYGGLSGELMALGKPVICYLRESDFRFLPPGMAADLPIINANPESITDVLRDVLARPRSELAAIGQRSRRFVERWHSPELIASRVLEDYGAALDRVRAENPAAPSHGR